MVVPVVPVEAATLSAAPSCIHSRCAHGACADDSRFTLAVAPVHEEAGDFGLVFRRGGDYSQDGDLSAGWLPHRHG